MKQFRQIQFVQLVCIIGVALAFVLAASPYAQSDADGKQITWKDVAFDTSINQTKNQPQVTLAFYFDIADTSWENEIDVLLGYQKQYQFSAFRLLAIPTTAGSITLYQNTAILSGLKCPILVEGKINGYSVTTVPVCLLFDAQGAMVKEAAHAKDLKSSLQKLMKDAPNPIIGNQQYPELKADLKKVEEMKKLAGACTDLENVVKTEADSAKGKQAKELLDRVVAYGQMHLNRAEAISKLSMVTGVEEYRAVAELFKGHPIGDQAAEKVKSITSSKEYANEQNALNAANGIRKATATIKPEQAEAQESRIDQLIKQCETIAAKFPDTEGHTISKMLLQRLTAIKPVDPDAGGGGYGSGGGGGGGGGKGDIIDIDIVEDGIIEDGGIEE